MSEQLEKSQGQRMAAILQRMADRRALPEITDPVAWQKEIREDRPLHRPETQDKQTAARSRLRSHTSSAARGNEN